MTSDLEVAGSNPRRVFGRRSVRSCGTSAPPTSARRNVRTAEGRTRLNVCTTELGTPDVRRTEGCRCTGQQCRQQQGADGRTLVVRTRESCTLDDRTPALRSPDHWRQAVCIRPRAASRCGHRQCGCATSASQPSAPHGCIRPESQSLHGTDVRPTDGRRIPTAGVSRPVVQPTADRTGAEPPSGIHTAGQRSSGLRTVGVARAGGCAQPEWRGPGYRGPDCPEPESGPRAEQRRTPRASGVRTSQATRGLGQYRGSHREMSRSAQWNADGCSFVHTCAPHCRRPHCGPCKPRHMAAPLSSSRCGGLHGKCGLRQRAAEVCKLLQTSAARCRGPHLPCRPPQRKSDKLGCTAGCTIPNRGVGVVPHFLGGN